MMIACRGLGILLLPLVSLASEPNPVSQADCLAKRVLLPNILEIVDDNDKPPKIVGRAKPGESKDIAQQMLEDSQRIPSPRFPDQVSGPMKPPRGQGTPINRLVDRQGDYRGTIVEIEDPVHNVRYIAVVDDVGDLGGDQLGVKFIAARRTKVPGDKYIRVLGARAAFEIEDWKVLRTHVPEEQLPPDQTRRRRFGSGR